MQFWHIFITKKFHSPPVTMSVHTAFQGYMSNKIENQLLAVFCMFIEGVHIVCNEGVAGVAWTGNFINVNGPNMGVHVIPANGNRTPLNRTLVLPSASQCTAYSLQRPADAHSGVTGCLWEHEDAGEGWTKVES